MLGASLRLSVAASTLGSGTMASILDSKVEFRKRCEELMGADPTSKLVAQGLDTFGLYAFAVADQADRLSDTKLADLTHKVYGADPTLGVQSALRRLAFEGLAHSCHDMRLRSEADSVASRPVPALEREAKRTEQVSRLKGLLLEGDLEPAHALIDKCAAMLHDGAVRYIPPSQRTSRDYEVTTGRKDKEFLSLEHGEISVKKKDTAPHVDVSTDYKLQMALGPVGLPRPRAPAPVLFPLGQSAPTHGLRPPGPQAIVRELWTAVARDLPEGCKPQSGGTRPLDASVRTAMQDYMVTMCLLPIPAAQSRGRPEARAPGTPVRNPPSRPGPRSRTPARPAKGAGKSGATGGGKRPPRRRQSPAQQQAQHATGPPPLGADRRQGPSSLLRLQPGGRVRPPHLRPKP